MEKKLILTSVPNSKRPIYLDYHATTPTDPRVAEKMLHFLTIAFGNASSIDHEYGDEAEGAVKEASKHVATLVGASPKEVIFTSGATESINLAIQGSVFAQSTKRPFRIALTPVEHKAVLDTCKELSRRGLVDLVYLQVDSKSRLIIEHLERVCKKGIDLLCVMAANNEVGTIYPIQLIGQIAANYNIPFLCDGSQAVGKIPFNFRNWGVSLLAVSAHKFYGPKGVGALVIKKGIPMQPILFGGGHQKGMRSGTLNVPGIVGMGEASRLCYVEMEKDEQAIALKRDYLQSLLVEKIPNLVVNGDLNCRLAGNLHISIPGVPNSAIVARIRTKLAISTGSACTSGIETPSHVLLALNLSNILVEGALRISLGKFTTSSEVAAAAEILSSEIHQIRQSLGL